MSISMKELAKILNVSASTISRVVNEKGNVNPETYNMVKDAIQKYHFVPNEAARNLKSCQSKTIGIIVSDLSNTFYTSIVSGAEAELNARGYSMILCDYGEDYDRQIEYAQLMLSRNVAGLIISPSGASKPYYDQFVAANIPIVYIDTHPSDLSNCNCVTIDNADASYRLASHMLEMYGDDIFVLSNHEGYSLNDGTHVTDLRYNAVKSAFADYGYSIRDGYEYASDKSTYEIGYQVFSDLLKTGKRPRALVSTSNNITYGAMAAIFDAGLSIPDDVAVACFDAIDPTGLVRPRITSITQPTKKMGELAARLVIDKIANPEDSISQKIMVEPIFEIRESCGYSKKINKSAAQNTSFMKGD